LTLALWDRIEKREAQIAEMDCNHRSSSHSLAQDTSLVTIFQPFHKNHLFYMKLMNHRILRYALLVAIILMTLSKLTLMGSGFFAFHDEFRYLEAGKASHLSMIS
jgi:hypothetical protein